MAATYLYFGKVAALAFLFKIPIPKRPSVDFVTAYSTTFIESANNGLDYSFFITLFAERILDMLGVKSNNSPIRGEFAKMLREQIAIIQENRSTSQAERNTKSSQEQKK